MGISSIDEQNALIMGDFTNNTRYRERQLNELSAQLATRILLIYVMPIHPTVGKFYASSVLKI